MGYCYSCNIDTGEEKFCWKCGSRIDGNNSRIEDSKNILKSTLNPTMASIYRPGNQFTTSDERKTIPYFKIIMYLLLCYIIDILSVELMIFSPYLKVSPVPIWINLISVTIPSILEAFIYYNMLFSSLDGLRILKQRLYLYIPTLHFIPLILIFFLITNLQLSIILAFYLFGGVSVGLIHVIQRFFADSTNLPSSTSQ